MLVWPEPVRWRKQMLRPSAILFLLIFASAVVHAGGPHSVTLSVDRPEAAPLEDIAVYFNVSAGLPGNAWIGLIPSHVPHGSEPENDKYDIAYQYLNNRQSGILMFKTPQAPGTYDFRLHDTDSNGNELASVRFKVQARGR